VETIEAAVDDAAERSGFSGVVRVDSGDTVLAEAYGLARRDCGIVNTVDTQFGIASGTNGLTALTVARLIEDHRLDFATTARSVLGRDLPLISDEVTVEQLLAHRSGIGDYVDEEAEHDVTEYALPVAVSELATTEQYLRVLDGHAPKFAPDTRFGYCNGGYVVLALIAERVTGTAFPDLVDTLVCRPAGMGNTAFLRSDELPGGVAAGYLTADGVRTNVFHLPVRGSGDGGIYSTVADIHVFWAALLGGRIVSPEMVAAMLRPRSDVPWESKRYGLGFWLHPTGDAVMLEGYDAGVSFRTVHDPGRQVTFTVISNTTDGAWPLARRLADLLDQVS
jgi:CubicO group peptidase (beta-lactamase class C family)